MMFTNKQLRQLIVPLIIEQFLTIAVGLADSLMIAGVGEAAVSAVSLVDTVMVLMINVFGALATGGAVVAGQYIGQKRKKDACLAADQLMLFVAVASLVITGAIYLGKDLILHGIFGTIEADVMNNCQTYLMIVTASIPFIALYNGGAAIFRSMGNSKISMTVSMIMNGINIAGNAILIYGLKMGIAGAAIPTLISRVAAAVIIILMLRNTELPVHISRKISLHFDRHLVRKILHIGIPNGLENSMFQLGKIIVLSLVASFGTVSIAANAVGNTIAMFQLLPGMAMNFALLTVVAQCVGAGDYEQVRYYTRKLMAITYVLMILCNVTMFFLLPFILQVYQLSDETRNLAFKLLVFHEICASTLWPLAFTLPHTLRAANDVKLTMWISVFSMWMFRIVFSWVLGKHFGMGLMGVWVAMVIDWVFRAICFIWRYWRGRWIGKKI